MKLTQEERFALTMIFNSNDKFDSSVRSQLNDAQVVERISTGVGFFSTIHFPRPLDDNEGRLQWDWNFSHQKLMYGGSFMSAYEPPNVIELEGVAFEDSWPAEFDSNMFVEA